MRTDSSVCKLVGEGNCRGGTLSTKLILLNYLNLSMNIKSLRTSQESWLHINMFHFYEMCKVSKTIKTESGVRLPGAVRMMGK